MKESMEDSLRWHLYEDHGVELSDTRMGVPWITHAALHQLICTHREVDLWQPRREDEQS